MGMFDFVGDFIGDITGSNKARKTAEQAARAQQDATKQSIDFQREGRDITLGRADSQLGRDTDWRNYLRDISLGQYGQQLGQEQGLFDYQKNIADNLFGLGNTRFNQQYGAGQDAYVGALGRYGDQTDYSRGLDLFNIGQRGDINQAFQGRLGMEDFDRERRYASGEPWQQGGVSAYQALLNNALSGGGPNDPVRNRISDTATNQSLRFGLGGSAGADYVRKALDEFDVNDAQRRYQNMFNAASLGKTVYAPSNVSLGSQSLGDVQSQSIGLGPDLNYNPLLGQGLTPQHQGMSLTRDYINNPVLGLGNPMDQAIGTGMQSGLNLGNSVQQGAANYSNAMGNVANAQMMPGQLLGQVGGMALGGWLGGLGG